MNMNNRQTPIRKTDVPYNYFMLDAQGLILETNQPGEELLGISKNELCNKTLCRYIIPENQDDFSNHINKTLNTKELQLAEINVFSRKGPIFPARIISKSFATDDEKKKYILSFIIKSADFQLQEINIENPPVKKLNEIIMHEINNPLAVTANYLYGCIHRLESGKYQIEEIVDALKKAYRQYHNMANIILRMKNFSCRDKLEFKLANINDIIKNATFLLNGEIGNFPVNIKIRSSFNIPEIKIDKLHIQQVILNLARNSIDAMRDHGTDEPKLWFEINLVNRKEIEVCVIDNGPGVAEEIKYKLFNHNFTTKKYGVGLGLSICRNIVEAHGGELLIDSTLAGNTCFKFTLPIN